MNRHVTRRLLLMIPTLLGVTLLVFMLVALSPGGLDAAVREATSSGDAWQREREREYLAQRYGLDDPAIVRYARWLHRLSPVRIEADGVALAAPDLGYSFARSRPVAQVLGEALPATVALNVLSLIVVYVVSVPLGILAALRRGSWVDALTRSGTLALWSLPVVVLAVAMQNLFSGAGLGWLPASGMRSPDAEGLPIVSRWLDAGRHMVLPVACLSAGSLALLSRLTRASVLENLLADHVRTARAKGLSNSAVIARHVLRNSLLPQITYFAGVLPTLLSGSIVVERVFNLPGMGGLMLEAIDQRDHEVLMAVTLMISLVGVLSLLAADLAAAAVDPRVRPA